MQTAEDGQGRALHSRKKRVCCGEERGGGGGAGK